MIKVVIQSHDYSSFMEAVEIVKNEACGNLMKENMQIDVHEYRNSYIIYIDALNKTLDIDIKYKLDKLKRAGRDVTHIISLI